MPPSRVLCPSVSRLGRARSRGPYARLSRNDPNCLYCAASGHWYRWGCRVLDHDLETGLITMDETGRYVRMGDGTVLPSHIDGFSIRDRVLNYNDQLNAASSSASVPSPDGHPYSAELAPGFPYPPPIMATATPAIFSPESPAWSTAPSPSHTLYIPTVAEIDAMTPEEVFAAGPAVFLRESSASRIVAGLDLGYPSDDELLTSADSPPALESHEPEPTFDDLTFNTTHAGATPYPYPTSIIPDNSTTPADPFEWLAQHSWVIGCAEKYLELCDSSLEDLARQYVELRGTDAEEPIELY